MSNEKRARAYDHLMELCEGAPEVAAKALLSACFNVLSADDFISMVEDEFEWEDEAEETDDPDSDDTDTTLDEE